MPRVRNASHEALNVPVLGREVQPDEVVDLPDELNGEPIGWPEHIWEPVKAPAKKEV